MILNPLMEVGPGAQGCRGRRAFAIWSILEQPGLDAGLGVLGYTPGHSAAAFCAELIGTFLLILVVFGTTTDSRATPGWYGLAIPAIDGQRLGEAELTSRYTEASGVPLPTPTAGERS